MAFIVTGAQKRPNSRSIKLLTPGGVVVVNGDTMRASATVNGEVFQIAQPDTEDAHRLLREEKRQLLHTKASFFHHEGEGARALAANGGSS